MMAAAALEQLADEIEQAAKLKALAGPDVLARWLELSRRIRAEARPEWFTETEFKQRTGASGKWCRKHYAACEAKGLARTRAGRREWHVSARPPSAPPSSDREGLIEHIASSFKAKAA